MRSTGYRVPRLPSAAAFLGWALAAACSDTAGPGEAGGEFFPGECNLEARYLFSSPVGRGGIPILDNPEFVSSEPSEDNDYLEDDDRVIGLVRDGEALAVPHNILWYHEVVNLDGEDPISVTYCPLTASSLAFRRDAIDGRRFGVSGVLFMNNLIMYDIGTGESFWPQMFGDARCGPREGTVLSRVPTWEMNWAGWKDLHPDTRVISSQVNISRDYSTNPYGDYDSIESDEFLFPQMPPLDRRRPVKERVLGLPAIATEPGIAFPFQALIDLPGSWAVVNTTWQGEPVVLFWSDQRRGGGVFRPRHPTTGEVLSFRAVSTSGIVDDQTGTRWDVTGRGSEGTLQGAVLEPVGEAYPAYWGAWAAFHPDTRLWLGDGD
ncbi:MAG: DUF3179 domain-containing protein [Gemmatimonadetes bacterium]|nr:DUF3179 domain-containing protein [Gemmatimonadota bacterium]